MASPKKSDCAQYEFKLIHEDAKALSAGLTTEVDYIYNDNEIFIHESADSIADLRARWNSLMRGLIASEQAVAATRGD
ncbi:MAG: hypothetical protein CXT72_00150 [Methanobacteriota archaeon]|jgi:tRNA threonylcarbamoyladenosine modification (KEOPS) complex  Pcc1 subunit|nr:MAG: hypothetical protein CXT72_00150 [Euryarchaeota archaeon]HIE63911.1 hypothetical protein [Candidatus Poseidoniales archaeon]HIK99461.1 hypothetical protein [Candidatus Poseidoniales archaeon]